MAELAKEYFVATVAEEEREVSCWGCGLRLILPSSSPIFQCGWCGAITNQNARKRDNKWFWWKRVRDRCFVSVLIVFMLFVICGGVWAVYPVIFSSGLLCGIFHSTITIVLSVTTILTFSLASFRCAGRPPTIVWGSYPVVGKGGLENYTFCWQCSRPKSPRAHHCRSCGMCVLDMDHHCPFIGNCVGAENHQNFIAFLMSAIAGTTYAAIMCAYVGLKIVPPIKSRPIFIQGSSSEVALNVIKGIILDWLSSALLLSTRGLILFYLFISSVSVATGLSVLLWQQLSYIYEGKTYLSHLSSSEDENIATGKDCNNIIRFLGCPFFVSRYFTNFQNSRKSHRR